MNAKIAPCPWFNGDAEAAAKAAAAVANQGKA